MRPMPASFSCCCSSKMSFSFSRSCLLDSRSARRSTVTTRKKRIREVSSVKVMISRSKLTMDI